MPYCPKCGAEVSEGTRFCPRCGQDLSATTATAPQAARIPEQVKQRPTGVTILAILQILGGLFFLVIGGFALVLAGFLGMGGMVPGMPDMPEMPMFLPFLGGVAAIIGIIMIAVGFLSFAVAYGYWNGLGWAWTLGLVVAVIGLILGLISLPSGIVWIIIDALVIYYLTRPHVKTYFGKKPIQVTI